MICDSKWKMLKKFDAILNIVKYHKVIYVAITI